MNHELLPELLAKAQKLTLDEQLQLMTKIEQMVRQHPPEESDRRLWEAIWHHQPEILALAAQRGASNVRAFDVGVRPNTSPSGEIHFLVNLEPGRSLLDLGGLTNDLQKLLECDVYVLSEGGLRGEDKERVLAETISL